LVDAATLTLLATFAQTIVITVTLLVFILQFRSQEKAIHESSYQNLMGRYNELIIMFAQSPSQAMTNRMSRLNGGRVFGSPDEAQALGHLLIIYGILEEAFILYKKKWIDKETWDQWAAWLAVMAEDSQFMAIHDASRGMFDKDYEDFISKMTEERKKQQLPTQSSNT
jgi:hypothetical protein